MKINWKTILKREKLSIMPEPNFEDNWKQGRYENNVKEGVQALQNGQSVEIMDDGRGYELALDIKRQFILEYQKQLSEAIKIEGSNIITISFKH
jgi:hypothetical protein